MTASHERHGGIAPSSRVADLYGLLLSHGDRLRRFVPPVVADRVGEALRHRYYHARERDPIWDAIGDLQLGFLIDEGLQPHHRLLDIGCGALRGGVRFMDYLDPGHYYGIDKRADRIETGRKRTIPEYGVGDADPNFRVAGDFSVSEFDTTFDYALAQSVFTHLPLNMIVRCLRSVGGVLAADGAFYATIFEAPEPCYTAALTHEKADDGAHTTHYDANPYHYHPDDIRALVEQLPGLSMTHIGEWGHPRQQTMLKFEREGTVTGTRQRRDAGDRLPTGAIAMEIDQ